ncbi:mannose-P-dolichol utilization defect 1 protein [Fomitiporia mediterranea MF3/22]|uniref:mannose-P-dolichol utilization defect 1 protein n=1 Tax=Fomitiporia mediterranea (strain MF3/22) TaxID=694068 RepID=UPI0004407F4C|nr:mannose-P-dolichol utilization defect 1 protein [Fomitiporia mediterranea MF3/22]EJC98091.1 mannose-P-dolichol utilization defect 1 protein [Fomitiporia mediterranea MF3/22]
MTSITQNFPWFIRDPAVAIVGEKCYRSLVEELNVGDIDCLKYALSKGLGIGIVVGGSIMKVPQVLIILRARSARGLSFTAYVLETLSYAITLVYSYRNDFPFSTYGENFFLTLQNALITVLMAYYPTSTMHRVKTNVSSAMVTLLAVLAGGFALYTLPPTTLALLQLATTPLSVLSKLPQIMTNHRARSTGQLSAFAVISQIAGCLARLFTTATEVGDPLLFLAFATALALNCVLGAQMWMYWGRDAESKGVDIGRGPPMEKDRVDIVIQPASPAGQQRFASPTGRRWSRKVD